MANLPQAASMGGWGLYVALEEKPKRLPLGLEAGVPGERPPGTQPPQQVTLRGHSLHPHELARRSQRDMQDSSWFFIT